MVRVDGQVVNVGDAVGFKCDIEQWGYITKISGSMLTLKAPSNSGFEGDYIGSILNRLTLFIFMGSKSIITFHGAKVKCH